MRSFLQVGPIYTINKQFLIHTRELDQRENLGMDHVLCINLDNFVANMFYTWSLSHNIEVPIPINNNKYFLSLNTYTTVFYWGAGNKNKNRT